LEGENADGTSFTMKNNGPKKSNAVVVVGLYNNDKQQKIKQPDPIFKEVDELPRFPGCEGKSMSKEALMECAQKEMLTFVYTNIKYPEQARKQGVEGTVVVKFVVDKTGKITTKELVRSIGGRTGEEVLRVVGEMPNFIPGKKDGKAVSVFYHLPVKFKLADDVKEELARKKKEKENIIYHPTAPQIPIGYKDEAVTFDAITLNVFPNPVQGQLSITLQGEAKNALVTVFDVTGKEFGTLIVNVRHKGKDYQKKVIVQ